MSEQSLRERLHPSAQASAAESRNTRLKLILGAGVSAVAAALLAKFQGITWAVPALLVAVACVWALFARTRHRMA
jgi:hypothetical protein